jgi:serine/threonine protein kinase
MTSVPVERKIGRYEIVREIGRGATAMVYLARQTDLDRDVALKELASFHAADTAFIERFLRESRLAGSLNHPNIVTVYEYFEHEGTPFIAMEYLERGSLRPLLSTLALPQVIGVLEGLLAGLAYAHGRGTVHRDLKPENVLVAANGTVKIADFGIAKAFDAEIGSPLTLTGTTVGTPVYMAPEQAMSGEVGPAADLYAVGVMAYEMLAGELPFHGSEVPMAIMLQHLHDPVPPLGAARPDLDPELCHWVERMLAKEPSLRPESAADAWDDLDEIAIRVLGPRWRRQSRLTASATRVRTVERPERTATTASLAPMSGSPRRPRRASVIGLACVLALALLGGGVAAALALSNEDTPQTTTLQRSTGAEQSSTEMPQQRPAPRTTLAAIDLDTRDDRATAIFRLTGPPLGASTIDAHDNDLTDGHGWFELEGAEIGAQTSGAANDALSVRVRKGKDLLRVDLRAEARAFSRLRVSRADGRTVIATLSKPAPSTGSQRPPGTVTVTEPTESTTPTTPTKPEKPEFGTR